MPIAHETAASGTASQLHLGIWLMFERLTGLYLGVSSARPKQKEPLAGAAEGFSGGDVELASWEEQSLI